ncbi:MAG TPA: DUF3617 family protein [Casimicrobiaceae bacterium]|nr:DUF3617 family protein [Casimicrobiaceae bacterium]
MPFRHAVPRRRAPARRAALLLAIACSASTGATLAAEPPIVRSGLWEISRSGQQSGTRHVTTMCLDQSVQAEMREYGMGMAREMCSKSDRRVEGNRVVIDAVCNLGTSTMTTHSVMTYAGDTAFHTDGTVKYDPPFMNMTEGRTAIDGKWVGACKPGQKPGDITLESGQTINMKSMMKK